MQRTILATAALFAFSASAASAASAHDRGVLGPPTPVDPSGMLEEVKRPVPHDTKVVPLPIDDESFDEEVVYELHRIEGLVKAGLPFDGAVKELRKVVKDLPDQDADEDAAKADEPAPRRKPTAFEDAMIQAIDGFSERAASQPIFKGDVDTLRLRLMYARLDDALARAAMARRHSTLHIDPFAAALAPVTGGICTAYAPSDKQDQELDRLQDAFDGALKTATTPDEFVREVRATLLTSWMQQLRAALYGRMANGTATQADRVALFRLIQVYREVIFARLYEDGNQS